MKYLIKINIYLEFIENNHLDILYYITYNMYIWYIIWFCIYDIIYIYIWYVIYVWLICKYM